MSPDELQRLEDLPHMISSRKKALKALELEQKSLEEKQRVEELGLDRLFVFHLRLGHFVAQHDMLHSPEERRTVQFTQSHDALEVFLVFLDGDGFDGNGYFSSLAEFLRQRGLAVAQEHNKLVIWPEESFWQ